MIEEEIEVLRNRKTGKLFVLLEEMPGERVRVVNDAGAQMMLSWDLFEEEPMILTGAEAQNQLSAAQLKLFSSFIREQEAIAERMIHAQQTSSNQSSAAKQPREPSSRTPRKRKPPEDKRTGLGARWSSAQLTFYRHYIDPLGPKQSFRIEVEGYGTVKMTKEQFLANFNDVVLNYKYRSEGFYSYPSVPPKAKQFLEEPQD